MSDAGNILPQAEIDALFKQATGSGMGTIERVGEIEVRGWPSEVRRLRTEEGWQLKVTQL